MEVNMSDNNTERKPYSYHTFIFPFIWGKNHKVIWDKNHKETKRKEFEKCLNLKLWERERKLTKNNDADTLIENYNTYHYFNSAARNALYDDDDNNTVVWCYRFNIEKAWKNTDENTDDWINNPKGSDNPAKYVINCKHTKDGVIKSTTKQLNINGIRLKLFNTGIGVLVFELENYLYKELEEINWLNEYGRRIYMPFLLTKNSCELCAEEISIMFNGENITNGKTWKEIRDFTETKLASPITYLLSNDTYKITTQRASTGKNNFFIEPIVDDRMFVACYYINKDFATKMAKQPTAEQPTAEQPTNEYRYLSDASKDIKGSDNCAAAWYKTIFVDSGDISCYSKSLLKEKLQKHTYDRWIEKGSLTGISEYSLVTVTSSDWDALYRNFLTQYIEMMILVLAQRASLLNFERMISYSAMGKYDICKIQDSYVKFQSQLLLKEVTPQQQGIELYKMLLDNLFIQEQATEIEKQISALSTQKSSKSENKENLILFILAALSIFDVVNYLVDWICCEQIQWFELINLIVGGEVYHIKLILSVVAIAAVIFAFHFYRRK